MKSASGMVWMEVLAALAAAALVTLLGLRGLHGQLERLRALGVQEREAAAIAGLQARLGRAWDQRIAHALHPGPWLLAEGQPVADGLELRRLWLRTAGPDGAGLGWEFERHGDHWRERLREPDGAQAILTERRLDRPGAILLAGTGPLEVQGGEPPPVLRLRFPEAAGAAARAGFAIFAFW